MIWSISMRRNLVVFLLLISQLALGAVTRRDPNIWKFTANVASTTTATGTIVVTGGVGVSGAVNSGGNITTDGSFTSKTGGSVFEGDQTFPVYVKAISTNTHGLKIWANTATDVANIINHYNAALQLGVNDTTYVTIAATTGATTFASTTDASSSTTGGLITSGGLGVAKKLYVGTSLTAGSTSGDSHVFTGTFSQTFSTAGTIATHSITHSDNTNTGSHASLRAIVGGSSGGDPRTHYIISGVRDWTVGIDNSDSDKFKIAASSALETTTVFSSDLNGLINLGTSGGTQFHVVNGAMGILGGPVSDWTFRVVRGTAGLTNGAVTLQVTDVTTDDTEKQMSIGMDHYDNSGADIALVNGYATLTANNLWLGGGISSNLRAATNVRIYTELSPTSGGGIQRAVWDGNGNLALGTAALATTATEGFLHLQSTAGLPTGVPGTTYTGRVPMIYDTTNHKICFYDPTTPSWRCSAAM